MSHSITTRGDLTVVRWGKTDSSDQRESAERSRKIDAEEENINRVQLEFDEVSEEIEVTGTFKYKKTDLVKGGFDPSVVKDQMYYASTSENDYIDLDANVFKNISDHELKL